MMFLHAIALAPSRPAALPAAETDEVPHQV